jgi:Flp pilus assembly protein TadG
MSREDGTTTIWMLGLCVAVLFLGGLSLDLWRTVAVRRELSGMADAAATAAANGLDETQLRAGTVQLDAARARAIANEILARDDRASELTDASIDVTGNRVVVTLVDDVPFSLLSIFAGGDAFTVSATAEATPQLRP